MGGGRCRGEREEGGVADEGKEGGWEERGRKRGKMKNSDTRRPAKDGLER